MVQAVENASGEATRARDPAYGRPNWLSFRLNRSSPGDGEALVKGVRDTARWTPELGTICLNAIESTISHLRPQSHRTRATSPLWAGWTARPAAWPGGPPVALALRPARPELLHQPADATEVMAKRDHVVSGAGARAMHRKPGQPPMGLTTPRPRGGSPRARGGCGGRHPGASHVPSPWRPCGVRLARRFGARIAVAIIAGEGEVGQDGLKSVQFLNSPQFLHFLPLFAEPDQLRLGLLPSSPAW